MPAAAKVVPDVSEIMNITFTLSAATAGPRVLSGVDAAGWLGAYFKQGFSLFKLQALGVAPEGVMLHVILSKDKNTSMKEVAFVRRALGEKTLEGGAISFSSEDLAAYLKNNYFVSGWTVFDVVNIGVESGQIQQLYILVK